jgi:hypothetical protein
LQAKATVVLYDNFDNNFLDLSWSFASQNAAGWNYTEAGTNLTVTDINPTVINTESYGTWATVSLGQSFTALNDFHVNFDFSWDSEESNDAMQYCIIKLYDVYDNYLSEAGFYDAWVLQTGRQYASVGSTTYLSGYNSLGLSGSATVDIWRQGDDIIDILWNDSSILSGIDADPLGSIKMEFGYYAFDDYATSFFGSEAVNLVSLENPPPKSVPEPATMTLLVSGLIGLTGFGRKKIFKK